MADPPWWKSPAWRARGAWHETQKCRLVDAVLRIVAKSPKPPNPKPAWFGFVVEALTPNPKPAWFGYTVPSPKRP